MVLVASISAVTASIKLKSLMEAILSSRENTEASEPKTNNSVYFSMCYG